MTVTRVGEGRHKAGHLWELRVDGVYAGVFETKRQAAEHAAAESVEPKGTEK